MNRNLLVKIGAIVIILSLFLSIFVGAVASFASDRAQGQISVIQGPSPDIDGDGIDNGLDSDIDGDGSDNGQDGNPTSTNDVDSVPPKDARVETAFQWGGGIAVLAVLGWLVALPYIRRRRGTATKR